MATFPSGRSRAPRSAPADVLKLRGKLLHGWRPHYHERAVRVATVASLQGHVMEAWNIPIDATGNGKGVWLICRKCGRSCVAWLGSEKRAAETMATWMHEPCTGKWPVFTEEALP